MRRIGSNTLGAVTAVAALATVAAAPSLFHATTPPAGMTGGFGEQSCVFCHIGSDVNAFGGSVRLEGLPSAWEPGREYVITIDLRADETAIAGFQLAARYLEGEARGRPAGVLEPVDSRTAVSDSLGVAYLHQTEAGSATHNPSGARWSFGWRAPSANAAGADATVVFHVAANSGNGDNSPLGDLVYTAEHTLPRASPTPTHEPRTPPS